ncbi:hypothetical protein IWW38_005722, partial [Coemansia aciculifera]
QRVLDDLSGSRLVKTKNYVFEHGDLEDFNKKYSGDDEGHADAPSNATSVATSVSTSEAATPHPGFDEEHIRYKYRPEVTVELHDFANPLETTDLQSLFVPYKRDDNIVRIKWFNRNRAIAWFTNPLLATEALDNLRTCEYLHVKPYVFDIADMKYFNPDYKMAELSAGGIARRRTISGGSGLARRNTVSGASHYHRGQLFASAAAAAHGSAVPAMPAIFGGMHNSGSLSQATSVVASPLAPA